MLWKILILAACAMAAWLITRPPRAPTNDQSKTQNLAHCPKCGVYHHPDAPCQNNTHFNPS